MHLMKKIASKVLSSGGRSNILKLGRSIYPYIRFPLAHLCMKPNFLVIGAQKSGTTSLFRYLTQHHAILMPVIKKELHYFDLYYDRGPKWYLSCFPFKQKGKVTGEKSPYYLYHPLAPQRSYSFNQQFKLIILLRDPVKRAYSHFHHEIENGRENRAFREAVEKEMERVKVDHHRLACSEIGYSFSHQRYSYYDRGRYAEQLELWMNYFARSQFYIETAERFFKEPQAVCSEIFNFVGLAPFETSTKRRHNPGKYDPISRTDANWLAEMYRQDNMKLEKDYGVDISDWL